MQAIILAAGQGKRLSSCYEGPKALIRLGSQTILEESLEILNKNGIADIIIVTGYQSEAFEQIVEREHLARVFNSQYRRGGSLLSLLTAKPLVHEDALILEADLIYEPRAISELVQCPFPDATLISGRTGNGDEVYAFSNGYRITALSKRRDYGTNYVGEFVGITKLSFPFLKTLLNRFDSEEEPEGEYDSVGLVQVSESVPLRPFCIQDLIWTEIDDAVQLFKARESVYPILQGKQAKLPTALSRP